MNHDEENQPNPEMKPWIDPELEARVIAWVAGEASPFEVAELERLCAEKPELAIFKRRIEAVHGLVGEAVRPEKEPLRMSEERRAKLLAAIGSKSAATASGEAGYGAAPTGFNVPKRRMNPWARQWWLVGAAACAAIGAFVVIDQSSTFSMSKRELVAEQNEARRAAREQAMTRNELAGTEAAQVKRKQPQPEPESVSLQLPTVEFDDALALAAPPVSAGGAGASVGSLSTFVVPGRDDPRIVDLNQTTLSGTRYSSPVSGSRLNLPAADLGATIDVATKQSLSDVSSRGLSSDGYAARYIGSGVTPKSAPVEQQVRMSVFEVTSKDEGYAAAATLGGTRERSLLETPKRATFGAASSASSVNSLGYGSAWAKPDAPGLAPDLSLMAQTEAGQFTLGRSAALSAPALLQEGLVGDKDATSNPEPSDAELEAKKRADQAKNPPPVPAAPTAEETPAAREAVSTFSLHVSDVSFRLAQSALARGETPDAARIRAEEFYNAFDYGDPTPAASEKIGARIEQSAHPFLQQRNLLRLALKVPATGRGAGQPLRLTVLLDTSGSMEREDRAAMVRRALQELVALLGANDRITLIGFARQPRILAEAVAGNQAGSLVDLAARTPAEGGTNLEEALKLASTVAERHRIDDGQNRIVLLTDGAANLGNADPARLATVVEGLRQRGIAFDACGVGRDGIDDSVLEPLTRKGDGRYYVLTSPDAADGGFARQLAGAFRPAAENVKLQVRFNPARVGNYRLIGFEQHRLREEDFRNDRVDAAELAADEGAVALYQVEVLPQGEGEIGELFVRFRDPASGAMVERSWTIAYDPGAPAFDRAAPSLRLAGIAALLAERLSGSRLGQQFKLGDFASVVNALRGDYVQNRRVQELLTMFEQMRRRSGE